MTQAIYRQLTQIIIHSHNYFAKEVYANVVYRTRAMGGNMRVKRLSFMIKCHLSLIYITLGELISLSLYSIFSSIKMEGNAED